MNKVQKETYKALMNIIKKERTIKGLKTLEDRIVRHYNAYTLDEKQFATLDAKILEIIIRKEENEN